MKYTVNNILPHSHFNRRLIAITCVHLSGCSFICLSVHPSVHRSKLVRAITFETMQLESPNLVYMCILGSSRTVLYIVVFDHDLQGHIWG